MIVLDLKLVLILLLLLLGGLLYFTLTAVSRRRQRRKNPLALLSNQTTVLRRQLDTSPFGLLLLDGRQNVRYQNPVAQDLLSPELLADLQHDVQQANGQARRVNLPVDQAVGWWICPLDAGTLVILENLNQQRRLERSAQRFLGNLSHELRTPLTAVLAHIEVLRTPALPQTVYDNSINQIQHETTRISRLVQDLLTLNRLETTDSLQLRAVDVTLIAEAVISDIILAAEAKEVQLSLQSDTGLPRVLADPDRLKQVFINLVDNAVKYSRAGDAILVQLSRRPSGVQILIQDSGPGIPAKDLPHVAERLFRGQTTSEGSGLGLAIVTEILKQHHSRLEIDSRTEGDTGTTVRFVLTGQD